MLRGDLVGSVAGVVRVSGEVAKEGSGGADGVRVFESTARGQFGWPQELCMDSRNSERPLARLRQVTAMARGQANVAVLEVEEHLPAARGGGHVLHMIVVLLDDVAAGTRAAEEFCCDLYTPPVFLQAPPWWQCETRAGCWWTRLQQGRHVTPPTPR